MSSSAASRPRPDSTAPCPCGSGRTFGECCEPVLSRQRPAASAEALMRSRFTAHVLGDAVHLQRTYLPTSRRAFDERKDAVEAIEWTRLEVHAHEPGAKPDSAMVDFTAYYRAGDSELALQEKSEFTRIQGEWYYARSVRVGPPPVRATAPKVGRNEPCPCGSGKKFKQCCGK